MTYGSPFPRYPKTTVAEQDFEAQLENLKAKKDRALKKLAKRHEQAESALARGVRFPSPPEIAELQQELDEGQADAQAISDVRMSILYPRGRDVSLREAWARLDPQIAEKLELQMQEEVEIGDKNNALNRYLIYAGDERHAIDAMSGYFELISEFPEILEREEEPEVEGRLMAYVPEELRPPEAGMPMDREPLREAPAEEEIIEPIAREEVPTEMEELIEQGRKAILPTWEEQLETLQTPFKFSGQVLAAPFIATEELGFSTPEELFKTGIIQKKYEKLPLWAQLLAELPSYAIIPTGGLSAMTIKASLSASPKVYLRWLSKVLTPAAKTEEFVAKGLAYVSEKITQKLTERQLMKVFEKLPTDAELKSVLTKDWYRDAATQLSKIPGMKGVIKKINPSGVVENETWEAILRRIAFLETTENKGNAILALLERYGDDVGLFGVKEGGLVTKVKIKPEFKGEFPEPALGDVLEYPTRFILNKQQAAYINTLWKLEDSVKNMLTKEGISVNELAFREGTHWVHRVVTGKVTEKGIALARTGGQRIGAKKPFEKTRYYEFMQQGIERGVRYGQSANQYFRTYYDGAMKMIADKRLASAIPGQTSLERMSMELRKEAVENATKVRNYTRLVDRLRKAKAGWKPPTATINAIHRWDAEIGRRLVAAEGKPQTINNLIKLANQRLDTAKQVNYVSKAAYKKAKEVASRPHLGTEAYINQPAFTGKIYPRETAETISRFFGDSASGWLKSVSNISSASRTMVATFDFSAPFIQGLPVFGRNPVIWAKATLNQFLTFFTPKMYHSFLVKEGATLQEMANHRALVFGSGMAGGGQHEMVEAIPMLGRVIARVPLLGKTLQKVFVETYGRFGISFSSFGDYSRVMLWKSMEKSWGKRGQLDELARIINHMTGAVSTKALGVASSQRAFESGFMFFAPRYTRAGLALFADITKGGYTSLEAIRAIGGYMAAGSAMYVGTCAALGQAPDFNAGTGRFMAVKIGDRYYGIGGFINSMVRFAADVYASAASLDENEPIDFIKLSRRDNPILRFLYNKSAQVTQLINGLATQEDYLGRKLETLEDWTEYILDFITPISMHMFYAQDEHANLEAYIAEMLGGRTFPEGVWEGVKDIRDRWSKVDYGKPYDELDIHDKRMLEKTHPEIRQFAQEANAKWAKWYPDEPRVLYSGEMDANDKDYSERMWASYREVNLGLGLMKDYPDKAGQFASDHALLAGDIRDRYPEVIAEFDRWRELDKQDWLLFDQAYDEYINMVVSPTWEDEFYNFNYDGYREAQESFKEQWGDMIYDEVRETLSLDDDIPPLYLELKAAREAWGRYYELEEGDEREAFRIGNPETDAFLFFFGRVTTTKSPGAITIIESLMEKYDIPDEALPTLKEHKKKVERKRIETERKVLKPLGNLMQEDPTLSAAIRTGNLTGDQRRTLVALYTKIEHKPGIGEAFEEWLASLKQIL